MAALRLVAVLIASVIGLSACATKRAPAPMAHRTNAEAVALIKDDETFRAEAYRGVGGEWLIGYGHALKQKPQGAITRAHADELLREDLALCESAIGSAVKVAMSANEFGAMASLCFTIGAPSFSQSSVVERLNRGDRKGAADAFLLFTKARVAGEMKTLSNLEERRRAERALFLKPDAGAPVS